MKDLNLLNSGNLMKILLLAFRQKIYIEVLFIHQQFNMQVGEYDTVHKPLDVHIYIAGATEFMGSHLNNACTVKLLNKGHPIVATIEGWQLLRGFIELKIKGLHSCNLAQGYLGVGPCSGEPVFTGFTVLLKSPSGSLPMWPSGSLPIRFTTHVAIRFPTQQVPYPCCHQVPYPCGHQVPYPCANRFPIHQVPYPCGYQVPYPCGHHVPYPCVITFPTLVPSCSLPIRFPTHVAIRFPTHVTSGSLPISSSGSLSMCHQVPYPSHNWVPYPSHDWVPYPSLH